MKFMIPFLIVTLPVASVAQSQPGVASGVPSVAIPKTTEVLVISDSQAGRLVMGPDFTAMTRNLARNIRENRLGVLSAVMTRG